MRGPVGGSRNTKSRSQALAVGVGMSEELFTVWLFSSDDWPVKAVEGVPKKLAVDYAHWMAQTQEARDGEIQRIIITDESNHTVFEWKSGDG